MSVAVLIAEPKIVRPSDSWMDAGYHESSDSIRTSELISALSYALDLTEGRSMGHSVRTCVMGMRLAQHIGMSMEEQADLYYALLLKDAGCSSNSSRLFHILNSDEIRAKRDVKTTDWTKVGFESLNFALTHVATESPLPQRMWKLLQVAATQQADSRDLVKIRCERGSYIAKKLGFSGYRDFRQNVVDYVRVSVPEMHEELSPEDTPRAIFFDFDASDYDLNWYGPGDWQNYTRVYPNGPYFVYVRTAGLGNFSMSLAKVTSGAGPAVPRGI